MLLLPILGIAGWYAGQAIGSAVSSPQPGDPDFVGPVQDDPAAGRGVVPEDEPEGWFDGLLPDLPDIPGVDIDVDTTPLAVGLVGAGLAVGLGVILARKL